MSAWPRGLPGIAYGADYNPEQWPRDVWPEDVALMRQAGVTVATVGVFAWALLEPEEGRFELDWLADVVDLLHANGIAVDLATATASPPPWLSTRYPETLPRRADGTVLWPGGRQAWCPSSPVFRERALALVTALADRFHDHDGLAMWHVSNELGGHNAHCYCDVSAAAFRAWLQGRYRDVAGLNEAWGTAFWSQRYGSFDEVLPPRSAPTFSNPTQQLDLARFSSDALLDHFRAERDVLHRRSPGVPVTTNLMVMSHVRDMDYLAWGPELDLVAQDHYLDAQDPDGHVELSWSADLVRGVARGRPWFLM
jgi:beta-galactosidase